MTIHQSAAAASVPMSDKAFVWPHTVTFRETNVMGNVYFARQFDWQGECREMFLKSHCPGVVSELAAGLRLITLNANAEFFGELLAFDDIELRMRLGFVQQNRIGLRFDTVKKSGDGWSLAARGAQDIACMRLRGGALEPTLLPTDLMQALIPYGA